MGWRPRNRVVTFAPPAALLVPLDELKAHLRVDHDDENASIERYARAAVKAVEKGAQRLLTPRSATLLLPGLPDGRLPIELPGGPVSTVDSVTADGDPIVGAVPVGDSPALLVPAADWPVVTGEGYPVQIVYTVGHDPAPDDLVVAVKLICGHFYEHRAAVITGTSATQLPMGARELIDQHRIRPA